VVGSVGTIGAAGVRASFPVAAVAVEVIVETAGGTAAWLAAPSLGTAGTVPLDGTVLCVGALVAVAAMLDDRAEFVAVAGLELGVEVGAELEDAAAAEGGFSSAEDVTAGDGAAVCDGGRTDLITTWGGGGTGVAATPALPETSSVGVAIAPPAELDFVRSVADFAGAAVVDAGSALVSAPPDVVGATFAGGATGAGAGSVGKSSISIARPSRKTTRSVAKIRISRLPATIWFFGSPKRERIWSRVAPTRLCVSAPNTVKAANAPAKHVPITNFVRMDKRNCTR